METLAVPSKVSEPTTHNLRAENSSTRKGHRIPPLTEAIVQESKKKRKNTAKGKKKRLHPSTPSNSDDSEKPKAEQCTSSNKSSEPNPGKGRKSHKCKSKPPTVQKPQALVTEEDPVELSSQAQESLRWEGVLEDPAAEAKRLEVYRENRRKRYVASRQTLLESIQAGLGPDPHSKLGRAHKAGPTAKVL